MLTAVSAKVDRNASVPLYLQVKNHLLEEIQTGRWKEDELVPTDNELCERYQVSKITVREAMKILANEGILERIQGKGTFIRKTKYEPHLSRSFQLHQVGEAKRPGALHPGHQDRVRGRKSGPGP